MKLTTADGSVLRLLNATRFKRWTPPWMQAFARRQVLDRKTFGRIYRSLVEREIARMEAGPHPPPRVVYAECTNACNATCVMCPRSSTHRQVGTMDDTLFHQSLQEIATSQVLQGLKKAQRRGSFAESALCAHCSANRMWSIYD